MSERPERFVAVLPGALADLVEELGLDFFDTAVLVRASLDADWRTGTIPGFTVTGYAVEWRLSYAGLSASMKRLAAAGAVRHDRVRGHAGELEVLVYDRIVRPAQPRMRGSGPGVAPTDPSERNRESSGGNRESEGADRESVGATSHNGPIPVDVEPPNPARTPERLAREELAAKLARGEEMTHPEGWVTWRTKQIEDERASEQHAEAARRRAALTGASSWGRSRAALDEPDFLELLEREYGDDAEARDRALSAYLAATSPVEAAS